MTDKASVLEIKLNRNNEELYNFKMVVVLENDEALFASAVFPTGM